jgi:acyl transferase domain-containing protein
MGAGLYRSEPVFCAEIDRCAERLRAPLGCDLRQVMFDQKGDAARLTRTSLAQPAIFTLSYALAKLWESWGVVPRAMLGHSIGEWVAACLAEVFTLEEALRLVSARGRLMEAQPPGAMLAIMRPEAEVRGLLGAGLEIAAVNASEQTVVAGAESAVAALEAALAARGVAGARVQTSHAFHSATMEPAACAFVEEFRGVPRRTPKQPWISNVTGKWITAEAAGDPEYWARQLRGTVRFADGLATLLATPELALVEVGAGRTLTGLAARHSAWTTNHRAVVSLSGVRDAADDGETIATALGRMWCAGAKIDWHAYYEGQERRRVPLPTYPFEGERYWIDAAPKVSAPVDSSPAKKPDLADWFYLPSWTRTLAPASLPAVTDGEWLVIGDEAGLAEKLVARLRAQGAVVRVAIAGAPAVAELKKGGRAPRWVLMLSDVTALNADPADGAGFNVLIDLAKALGEVALPTGARLTIAANGLQAFAGEQRLQPGKALLHGPARVVPKEVPGLEARVVDVVWPGADADMVIDALLDEARGGDGEFVALRGRDRWRQTAEPVRIEPATARWRERGVYLITGGLGGIGLALAEDLARRWRARLVLVGRTAPGASVQKRIDALVAAGGEVVTAAVEVSDESAVRKLRDEVRARFGAVHGIIHAAGVAGGGVLARRTAAETAAVLTPKVAGTRALDRVFAADGLDFFVLMSSLTAQLGEFGQADYAAANAFIDAYAQARQREGAPMIAIGWDAWRDSGMAARVSAGPALVGWQEAQRARQLTDAEGAEVLQRAVGCGAAHILISTHDLAARRTADAAALSGKESGQVRAVVARHPRPALPAPLVLPRNDGERALAAIWEELLGIESVGVNDSFFDLGGHSLLATQVLARVREAGGAGLTLAAFFEAPTIATFAERITAQARGPSEPALVPAPRDQPLPLSFSQQALWVLDRMDGASVHYNEFGAQRIRGRLQPALLAAALTDLMRRHEALRTRFVERDGGPVQEILPPFAVELPVIALGGRTLEEHAAELTAPAFDLLRGPLLRARLVAVAPDEHVFMVVVHHIVFDGWSSGIFFREMIAVYRALVAGEPAALPAPALQYADFAVWQRAWLAGERQRKLADFWRGQLAGKLPVLALPTDRPRPTQQSFQGKKLPIDLGADLTGRLEALGRGQEASLFMTLLAGYAILLGRTAAQEDVIIGCPTAGRERQELEPLIGFFINPLAILVSLAGDPRFGELLARVRKTVLSAYAHSALPFEQVVQAVHPKRDLARSPIFQVLFVFQNSTPVSAPPAGLTLDSWEAPDVPARSDIDLYLWETPGGVRGHFVYNADLFSESTVRRLAARWRMLLEAAATTPEARVTELRMEQTPQLPRLASLTSRGAIS